MRIVITGATGNVGTSVLAALATDVRVREIVGISRRAPVAEFPKTTFAAVDIARDELEPYFWGADAVIHLAWRIQPAHAPEVIEQTNVDGSRRVFNAVRDTGVPVLLYASSVGAYSPAPKFAPYDESWPTQGVESSTYSLHKATVEHMLDAFEAANPEVRVVRLRPALIFKREAATRVRRLFMGPLLPRQLLDRRLIRRVLEHPNFRFQAVHSFDVAEAFRLSLLNNVRGAFNVAADPVLDSNSLAEFFDARLMHISPEILRAAIDVSWRLRLHSFDPGWVDLCFQAPIMDVSRARDELGFVAKYSAIQALQEIVDGLRDGAGFDTPPLAPPGQTQEMTRDSVASVRTVPSASSAQKETSLHK